jgi:hypothetical protein
VATATAAGCTWLRSVTTLASENNGQKRRSRSVYRGRAEGVVSRRRAWDSNPRGRVNALMVFKTPAGHRG